MLLGPLGIGHSVPIMGSLCDQNQYITRNIDSSFETREATLGSTTVEIWPSENYRVSIFFLVHYDSWESPKWY